jgi:uncharacterized phage protein (TIGR02220 family)
MRFFYVLAGKRGLFFEITMAKRFTDTEKYKKKFIRSLSAPYKIFWDYLYHDCSFAGIWHVDFEIAQIFVGLDAPIEERKALELFNKDEKRIIILNEGKKWLILPFLAFQYGQLVETNKLHIGVLRELNKLGVRYPIDTPTEGDKLGAKEQYKEKNKDKEQNKEKEIIEDLNLVLNTSYKPTTIKTRELIEARLNEGFTLEDFKKVHRNMYNRWFADNKMREFLRPITLYSNKQYLQQVLKR